MNVRKTSVMTQQCPQLRTSQASDRKGKADVEMQDLEGTAGPGAEVPQRC